MLVQERSLVAARRCLKRCAATVDLARRQSPGVTILIYHRVGRLSQTETDLPTALFGEQMEFLAQSGRVVTLDTAVRMLGEDAPNTPNPIVITFDDGTGDFADHAMPVLDRLSLPATLYLATYFLEHARPFHGGGLPMSWSAARDVLSTGLITIGSHTHTHPRMDRLGFEAAAGELDRSVALIADRLAVRPEHFAYPYSVVAASRAEPAVRDRFRSAVLAGTRPNHYASADLHRLARAPIQVSDGMTYFHKKLEGGMRLEDTVRHAINPAPRTALASQDSE